MTTERPVFILGAPRSGTTLMRSIIDAHPNICCPPWETGLFVNFDEIVKGDVNIVMKQAESFPLSRADLVNWVRTCAVDLLSRLSAKTGKQRWAEKTPAHVFHIDLIHEVFPSAQFVHMIRNGRDVVQSLQNMAWAPRRITWSARRWVESVQMGRDSGRKLPPGQYLEVRYENLLQKPTETIEGLCEFLGESFEPKMLQFHKPENNSWGQAEKPIQDKPLGRYPKMGLFERLVFSYIASPLLRELNYR